MVDAKPKLPTIILLRESWLESLIRDAGTFIMLAGLIGIGVAAGSSALQWIGGIMGMIWLAGKTMHMTEKYKCTIAEARKRLDELEAYNASI